MISVAKALAIVAMFLGGVGAWAQSYTPDLLRRAEHGDAKAQFDLGLAYAQGRGIARDDVQAVAWYRKAAEQGDAIAQLPSAWHTRWAAASHEIMHRPLPGIARPQNRENARAQTNLGGMYGDGQGVARDNAQAAAWYRKAAAQGFTPAQTQLDTINPSGKGVARE